MVEPRRSIADNIFVSKNKKCCSLVHIFTLHAGRILAVLTLRVDTSYAKALNELRCTNIFFFISLQLFYQLCTLICKKNCYTKVSLTQCYDKSPIAHSYQKLRLKCSMLKPFVHAKIFFPFKIMR